MILKVLGTGSSGNCYLFKPESGKSLIIDCGINFKEVKKAVDFKLESISAALQTHSHGDHCKFSKDFIKYGIDVYMSEFDKKYLGLENNYRAKVLTSSETLKVDSFKVLPFDVKHDVPCLGFLIEHPECGRFCLITDTYYCKYKFKNLNNIIIEANYSKEIIDRRFGPESDMMFLRDRILKSHFSLANCKEMLAANDLTAVNNIVLIHLSDGNSNELQFKKEVHELTGKNVTVACNGIEIPFGKYPF